MTTTNMSLNEPSVGVTTGPDWATQVNENFETIDTHDHTSGKGVQLTPSALNINADLEFNSNAAIELKRLTFDSGATGSGTNYSVYQQGGNLYWYNGSGQAVQITNGASVKTTGGSIDGMSGTDAQVLFGSGIYRFEFDTTLTPFSGSKMAHADILLYKYDGSTGSDAYVILKYTGSSAGSNNITVPDETGTMLTTSTSFGGNISIAATGGSNTITLDAEGDINLDSNSGVLNFKENGTAIGKISNSSSDLVIENEVDAKDIIFKQYDGNEVVRMADDRRLYFFDKGGEYIVGDGTDLTIASGGALNVNTGSSSGNDLKVNTSQLVVEGDTGNVGIGATTLTGGNTSLDIHRTGSGQGNLIRLKNQHNDAFYVGQAGDTTGDVILYNSANTNLLAYTNGTERLRINSSGSITTPNGEFNGNIGSSVRGTMVLLAEQTVTSSTLVAITLPSTTNVHRFVINAEFYGSATDNVNFIIKNSSGTAFTCRVAGQRNWGDGGSAPSNLNSVSTSGPGILVVYNTPAAPSYANIILDFGSASTAPNWEATSHQYAGSYSYYDQRAAYSTSAGIVTSCEFDVVGSSTITGNYKIYGIKT